jgi:Holliday junction resolvase RusA-like endonuclease
MIVITLEGLPPSSNQAYVNQPSRKGREGGMVRGGRMLTQAGKAYKAEVIQHIVKNHAHQTRELRKDATIGCFIAYGFHDLINSGWPKKAAWRYKKSDLTNRAKLLQDAIVEATAMDDSQICFDYQYKYQSEQPMTTVYIWNEDDDPIGQRVLQSFAAILRGPTAVQPL